MDDEEDKGSSTANGFSLASILSPFGEQSESDRPFIPVVGGPRLFILLLYVSVVIVASIEFFAGKNIWYGSWELYNTYVFVVSGVFVFKGMVMLFNLADNGMCFACGKNNEKGLHLDFSFYEQENRVETTFVPRDMHQGWQGVVHGGIIATLMDEAMAKVAQRLGHHVLTASLDVRFKDIARTGDPLHVRAEVANLTKKLIYTRAVINRGNGEVVAEGHAKLIIF